MTIAWLIVAVILFIGEMVCPIFFMFWFGVGAIVSLIVSLFTTNIMSQVIVFFVVSLIFVLFMKPLTNKVFKTKAKDELNMNGIIGKTAVVIKDIDNLKGVGEVKINGEVWSAINSNDGIIIETGKKVEIVRVEGVKLIVKVPTEIEMN